MFISVGFFVLIAVTGTGATGIVVILVKMFDVFDESLSFFCDGTELADVLVGHPDPLPLILFEPVIMDGFDAEQVPNSVRFLDCMKDFPLNAGFLERLPQRRIHGIIPLALLNTALGKHVVPGILAGINEQELGIGEVDSVQTFRVSRRTVTNTLEWIIAEGSEENWNASGDKS